MILGNALVLPSRLTCSLRPIVRGLWELGMIEAFSLRAAHHFQDALSSQARLRYEVFVQQRGLCHSAYDELEFEEFDTPSAIYLVWRDEDRIVRGTARLLRTTRPYMLQTYWPYLVEDRELPVSPSVFEVTRVCVDKSVAPARRQRIFRNCSAQFRSYSYGTAFRR